MNLSTTYLGMSLHSPLVVSASPLSEDVRNVKRMEDAGAGAIVLFSLFEEQVRTDWQVLSFFRPHPLGGRHEIPVSSEQFHTDLDGYLTHIRTCKEAVDIPIIASLNCTSLGTWIEFAHQIEQAGADALELHIHFIPTDMDSTSEQIEDLYCRILKAVKSVVGIPVAVKVSPFFTNMMRMARRLDSAGANALVLFNRFFQPDFDPQTLQVQSTLQLSTSADSRLPLHWIAILHRRIKGDLAATSGIHTAEDVVKMLMVGAKVTMLASALLREGIEQLRTIEQALCEWMDKNSYTSISELQGLVSQFNSRDPSAFERVEYLRTITSFKPVVWEIPVAKTRN
jgi:dihydroorotate dehydrogenase (fumarate)